MSYIGKNPSVVKLKYIPQSTDPSNPREGEVFYSNGTPRAKGLWMYKDNAWRQVGSDAAGSGGINYILNPSAEVNTEGWETYEDAASATPVNGTDGTANVTWTRSTTTPLRGEADFLFTKDAANRQGQGVSYDFTIDNADAAKVLQISFDYEVVSGTYTDGELTFWIYDVTNDVLIQPSGYTLENVSGPYSRFDLTFQTNSDSTSYRLIIHIASTNATAYTIAFDNFRVGPQQVNYGSPETDWQDFPSVAAGTLIKGSSSDPTYGNVQTNKAQWRRVGGDMEIRWDYRHTTAGNAGTGIYLFDISQLGVQIDVNRAKANTNTGYQDIDSGSLGTMYCVINGAAGIGAVTVYNTTQLKVSFHSDADRGPWGSSFFTFAENAGLTYSLIAKVPILGWSSGVVMSDSADTRVVSFVGYVATDESLTGSTTNMALTAIKDSHGAWTGSTYDVPVPGDYFIQFTNALITSSSQSFSVYVNGSSVGILGTITSTGRSAFGKLLPDLKAGDVISIRADGNITIDGDATAASAPQVSIFKLSGPSQIAASDSVSASYYRSSNQSLTADTTIIDFDTEEWDSHGAVTTGESWKFTAPISGEYEVIVSAFSSAHSNYYLRKNGSSYKFITSSVTTGNTIVGTIRVKLLTGEYVDVISDSTVTLVGGSAPYKTYISISRVGNY